MRWPLGVLVCSRAESDRAFVGIRSVKRRNIPVCLTRRSNHDGQREARGARCRDTSDRCAAGDARGLVPYQHIAEGGAEIIRDKGVLFSASIGYAMRSVARPNSNCVNHDARDVLHLLGRRGREEVARLLGIDHSHHSRRRHPTVWQQAHVNALTARIEDGLLQQAQHIGIGAEHHLLMRARALRFVLQAQVGEGDGVNLVRDGTAQASQSEPDDEAKMSNPTMKPRYTMLM